MKGLGTVEGFQGRSSRLTAAAWGRRLLLWLTTLALLAAGAVIGAGTASHTTDPTITQPKALLVAVRGTTQDALGPGLAAFIAVIEPQGRRIGVIRVPGNLPTPTGEHLAALAPTVPPDVIADNVAQDMQINLSGYVVFDAEAVQDAFTTLATETPGWPTDISPQQALAELGWPNSRTSAGNQLHILRMLILNAPMIRHGTNLLVARVLEGTSTDLSPYEIFLLATYINDEKLAPTSVHKLPAELREKQVKQ